MLTLINSIFLMEIKKNQLIHMIIRGGTSFRSGCLPIPTTPVPFIS